MKDFFISYNSADQRWAEWIAWQLESAGYETVIQAWDFLPGENFVLGMHEAAAETRATILVLSPDFLASKFAAPEWAAAFGQDPQGRERRVLPVRVRECKPEGLLRTIIYIDLVGLDEASAKAKLLEGVKAERIKPGHAPSFPRADEHARFSASQANKVTPDFPGAKRTALKALRPFDKEDAEIFQRLQRERELHDCLTTITDRDFRLGILFGESGCGKTSFVQAGLWPVLPQFSATHFPVYVKFSELDPLVSVRHALREQLPELFAQNVAQASSLQAGQAPQDGALQNDIVALLEHAAASLDKTLVLFFDQFEQFFLHFPKAEQRAPFIAGLKAWYEHAPHLPVKILLCLRQDYYGHHYELQQALRYTLGPQDGFALRKFSPKQATEIFHVLAESASLAFDRGFVEDMTTRDLAAKEDGLISPVDIQILTWMASAQEDAALNRTSFQKMGGVEGLLENYVKRSLEALATKAEQQTALKVLLALIDLEHNLRAGALSAERIKEKLSQDASLHAESIERAINWLASNKVRLITPVSRDEQFGYELAHERLIQPLRRLTNKELSEVDQASLLLERRVNEWLGNNRDSRYLLNWRELQRVQKQQAYLTWGQRAEEKQTLLARSKRRLAVRAGAIACLAVLLVGLELGWPMLEKARAQRELAERRQQLEQLLQRTDIDAKERVSQVHQFTQAHDPRPEVTTLDSMQFCYVPSGPFWMGSADADSLDEFKRLHLNKHLNYGYWISRFPITVAQFKAFVHDSAGNVESLRALDAPDNRPVVNVSWYEAQRFCEWLTRKWRKEGRLPHDWEIRLPSEAEWEKAARGGLEIPMAAHLRSITAFALEQSPQVALQPNALSRRHYPWGEQFEANLANSWETKIGSTSTVGCFPRGQSPYGCEEMSGNVWQWTRSWYRKYPYDPHDGREDFEAHENDVARGLRGGSWLDYSGILPCAIRYGSNPDSSDINVGFRVVRAQSRF
jgi:formylglycine-generating enzyme required for sulfatase activity